MGPKNPRSKFLTLDDEVIILAYRWRTRLSLDDSLVRLRRLMPQLSRSALYRCLERHATGGEADPCCTEAEIEQAYADYRAGRFGPI